ncbi:hypothetical protein J2X54_001320 [Duganella sp. 3397]|uniref:hypothetical protein n=1 Tax=Duganella sp. 3397 TaxID=2817732 RepID=UPI00285D4E9E|nr:hypothetical protein [Duganella sp. 3397]MDR7048872.1 hypothetical protein [Duganella sp. 3397]
MWGGPLVMAMLTVIGLLSALLGDGFWDSLSAVALGIPVLACAWFGWRRRWR